MVQRHQYHQDAQQLRDGVESVPACSLPQEAEAGVGGSDGRWEPQQETDGTSCINVVSNCHHHHGPGKENVTVSGQHLKQLGLLSRFLHLSSSAASILELYCLQLIILTFGPLFSMATSMDTVPAHLLPLAMEEFPHSLATACICRAGQHEPRLRCVQCGIIEEEEEDYSTLEEDQAKRSFLQTLERLRRSTR
ncbi:hypothetical protein GOODEAATRI_022293 [Goodea atripinnis]|uniref:Uncharacterized protein n=1 Tax=Goodea atripinnis TaxID=208336 RepID=A0ABV0MUE3_9TELE